MGENIEKIFYSDVAEKKRTGRGIYGRASRRGKKGPVKFQHDWLKGKEKKAYAQPGEVVTYSLAKIITVEELNKLPYEKAQSLFREMIDNNTNKELQDRLKIGYYDLYKLQKYYDAFRSTKTPSKLVPQEEEQQGPQPFVLAITGQGVGEDLEKQLSSLGLMLNKDKKYAVRISIKEEVVEK